MWFFLKENIFQASIISISIILSFFENWQKNTQLKNRVYMLIHRSSLYSCKIKQLGTCLMLLLVCNKIIWAELDTNSFQGAIATTQPKTHKWKKTSCFYKWKTTLIIFDWKTTSTFLKMEDNHNFGSNGRWPQYSC